MAACWARWVLCAALLAGPVLASGQTPVSVEAEAAEDEKITDEVAEALWWGDFDALNRLYERYREPGQRMQNGWPRLGPFRGGIDRAMAGPADNVDAFYGQLHALTLRWARENPRSGLAHALHAKSLTAHAWKVRGTGYANTVPPEAWADFERLMQQAQAYLATHAEVAQTSTLTHSVLLMLARVGGWSESQLWAVLDDGLRRNPEDVVLYRQGLSVVLPKWGGDAAKVDPYIRRVVERTRAEQGLAMYARLYGAASRDQFEHRLFEDSGARWADMAQGWRDLLSRQPSVASEHRFAYFACLARDKPVLLELLEKIGDKPHLDSWGANARRTFDTCRRWAQAS